MHPNADNLIASRFDTVIYDLDGTLIDSARDMCVAVSRVLADHGLPAISDEDARQFMGEGSKVTMRRAFAKAGRTLDEAEASAVTREFVRYYEADPVSHTTAFDGVAEVVARFDRMGLKQGVCTNKFENPSRIILQHLKLMPPITDVAGADTFTVRKPDPGHILQLIDKMGGHRDRAVMIGDFDPRRRRRPCGRAAGRAGELGLYRQARQRARRRGRDRSFRRPARRAGADCRPLTAKLTDSPAGPIRAPSGRLAQRESTPFTRVGS